MQLAYQDRSKLHLSLGASDLQVVILGDNQVGYTHPNKIYGAMFIGKPILYIGPIAQLDRAMVF
jgi:colanic acid biosynthesis glycosyl transferase WcaI